MEPSIATVQSSTCSGGENRWLVFSLPTRTSPRGLRKEKGKREEGVEKEVKEAGGKGKKENKEVRTRRKTR